jgi:putative DNA primase/helicase
LPSNATLDESLLKELTGGESITARHPYGRPFTFVPTAKIVIFGNNKPTVKDLSEGFWRRMLLVPFTCQIPDDKRKPLDIVMEDFRKEQKAIFTWCLQGYIDWKHNGLLVPDVVLKATEEYKAESDFFVDFIEWLQSEMKWKCTFKNDKEKNVLLSDLYDTFRKWTTATNSFDNVRSSRSFAKAARDAGFQVVKLTDNKTFILGFIQGMINDNTNYTPSENPF